MPSARIPDNIWADDLFKRRDEAQQLIAYIESVVGRPSVREDKKAYTIAIDARYGEGKSFFLKRLAENLSINHPVAFVDAWADDLTDEPLTALAATLKRALEPFASEPVVRDRVRAFMQKTGKVAKIVTLGLARRGVGLLITGKAVDAAEDVLSGVSDDVKEAIEDGLKDASQASVDETAAAISSVRSHSFMEKRISAFEEGRAAVREMKQSLEAIVSSLDGNAHQPPIVIVIDELDRCRPTYAIKLLEEIKHLFDVPGLVFILAMHGDQLGYSVSGAYGAGFDGKAYLRRFIDREYRLAEPDLNPLISMLYKKYDLPENKFTNFPIGLRGGDRNQAGDPGLIAFYMKAYCLKARDAFTLVDILQTTFALTGNGAVFPAYLIPLIIGHIQGMPIGTLPSPVPSSDVVFLVHKDHFGRDIEEVPIADMAKSFQEAAALNDHDLMARCNGDQATYGEVAVQQSRVWGSREKPLWAIENYPRLLTTVSRFTNPQINNVSPLE